eukprot:CAMPEP_0116879238 /NCGR_PEP_ID=MMETSP0463-20121206/11037_1 /TAXON_ID=181622 /ORGANISM="Strombidinopsis sp, Strain SopsisLIS2011" /LENGTH=83 /DNA_ID=CAMNT_0004528357 /DNA_START=204 /DNA_END=455 /DNA_ORIENTATION=+
MRDMSHIEELLKTKGLLTLMDNKLEEGTADLDIMEFSMAAKMCEHKLQVLTALSMQSEEDTEDSITINLYGSGKALKIDKKKL